MSSASRPVIGMLSTDMTPGGQSRPHTCSDDARRKGDQLTSRMPEISSHCVSSHLCRSRACMFELHFLCPWCCCSDVKRSTRKTACLGALVSKTEFRLEQSSLPQSRSPLHAARGRGSARGRAALASRGSWLVRLRSPRCLRDAATVQLYVSQAGPAAAPWTCGASVLLDLDVRVSSLSSVVTGVCVPSWELPVPTPRAPRETARVEVDRRACASCALHTTALL